MSVTKSMFPDSYQKEMQKRFTKPVTYRIYDIETVPDGDGGIRQDMPTEKELRTQYMWKNPNDSGDIRHIRYITGWREGSKGGDENPIYGKIIVKKVSGGELTLNPNNPIDRIKYEILESSPDNGTNPNSEKSAGHTFYRVDLDRDAASGLDLLKMKHRAIILSQKLTTRKEMEDFLRSLNPVPVRPYSSWTDNEVQFTVADYADKNPDKFMHFYDDINRKFRLMVSYCNEKGVIAFEQTKRKINWSTGYSILTVPMGKDWIEVFVDFLATHVDGAKVYAQMVQEMERFGDNIHGSGGAVTTNFTPSPTLPKESALFGLLGKKN